MSAGEEVVRPGGPIAIDQLLALNEEIAALVRAGVPLDRGLLHAGRDVRGRLGRIAGALSRRLSRGEDLVDAMAAEGRAIPPLYRAVVAAGARAGRLSAALEGMAGYLRGVTDARRAIGLALWYPVMVICLGYFLFLGLIYFIVPRFAGAVDGLDLTRPIALRWLGWLNDNISYWWPVGPVLLVLAAVFWSRSGTTAALRGGIWGGLRWFPWVGPLLADYEAANFAELLALLLEHRVPYPAALKLAADAAGGPTMTAGARRIAEAIGRGEPAPAAVEAAGPRAFPPMLRWSLATLPLRGAPEPGLRHLGQIYRSRARYRSEQIALFLPMLLTVAVGAGVVAFYALSLFLPLVETLNELAAP